MVQIWAILLLGWSTRFPKFCPPLIIYFPVPEADRIGRFLIRRHRPTVELLSCQRTLRYLFAIVNIAKFPIGSRQATDHAKNTNCRMVEYPVLSTSTRFPGYKRRDMRGRHAISPVFAGHYQDLGKELHDSAPGVIVFLSWLSVDATQHDVFLAQPSG